MSHLAIDSIQVSTTAPTRLLYEVVSGTPVFVSETDVEPVNSNLGSSSPLIIEAKFDTDITDLTSDGVIDFEEAAVANTSYDSDIASGIIIPQGKAVAFKRVAASGAVTVLVRLGELS